VRCDTRVRLASKNEFEEIARSGMDCFFFLEMVVCRSRGGTWEVVMSNSGGISKIAFLVSELKNRHPPRVIVDGRIGRVYGEEYAG